MENSFVQISLRKSHDNPFKAIGRLVLITARKYYS